MKPRQKRMVFVAMGLVGVVLAYFLVNSALQSNISYFFSPSQVEAKEAPLNQVIRIGGEVKKGTLKRQEDGLTVHFVMTDKVAEVTTSYTGILPDLFKEEQMAVAKGKLKEDGIFYAEEVLAKHDESYVPPEVAAAMKEAQEKKAKSEQEATQ